MSKYKMIALDLDNTLLNTDKSVSPENMKAVADSLAAGIRVILASGRAIQGMLPFVELFKTGDSVISYGGGETYDKDGELIHSEYLPSDTASEVLKWVDKKGVHYQAYLKGTGMAYKARTKYSDFYEKQNHMTGTVVPDLKDLTGIQTPKILLVGEPDILTAIKPELREAFPGLKIINSEPIYLEILNPQTSKGNALKRLAEAAGILKEEVMAIGDSEIDADMLKYAGLGVCMANGTPAALAAADYITGTNDEHGVADAINKFALAD